MNLSSLFALGQLPDTRVGIQGFSATQLLRYPNRSMTRKVLSLPLDQLVVVFNLSALQFLWIFRRVFLFLRGQQ